MDLHALQQPQVFRPVAPSSLTKEHQGIWNAWTYKSDREIAREAAAKGHVLLAMQFLSARNSFQQEQAKDFINSEVFKWVAELLDRKQIFRVSHILSNVGIDPGPELTRVFCHTDKKYLRDYIGDYLNKSGQLTKKLQDIWHFFDAILKHNVITVHNRLRHDTIQSLQEMPDGWKYEIAGKIFLRSQDPQLEPFLNADVLWNLLLSSSKADLVVAWISVSFSGKHDPCIHHSLDGFLKLFRMFSVTDKMLHEVSNQYCTNKVREEILNEFGKYGKFTEYDLSDVVRILKRINKADNVLNIYKILNQKHSNLPLDRFTRVLVKYCLDHNFSHVLNHCSYELNFSNLVKEEEPLVLRLFLNKRFLSNSFCGSSFCDIIFYDAKYLSEGNFEQYFCDNPITFISTIIFSQNLFVITTVKEKSMQVHSFDIFNNLMFLINKSEIFQNIYNNKIMESHVKTTYHNLLRKHMNVDIKSLFLCGDSNVCPNFNSAHLVEQYGYHKKINYIFYIKECRPGVAYDNFSESSSSSSVKRKIMKLGILDFENKGITAATIAFSEMVSLNSDVLRVCFRSAKLMKDSYFDSETIKTLFLKVDENPRAIQDVLEPIIVRQIDFENLMLGSNFVEAVNLCDIIFRFCILFNLPFPEMFLKQCAVSNLWLPFVLYVQLKKYPVDQVKTLVPTFKNPNLVEHIVHSVLHDIETDDLNVLIGERNHRKYYLSRIGVRYIETRLTQENSSYHSVSLTGSQGSSVDSLEIDVSNVKTTLLQTVIRCHNSIDPPRAFLQACQLYKYPFLAIVATCYEPDSVIINWIAWLSVSTEMYEMFTSFENLSISGPAVANFLNRCMQKRLPKTLLESFSIFIPENPLRYFLLLLNSVILQKPNISELKEILDHFSKTKNQRRGSVFSEKDYEMMYIQNKLWIETTSLRLLASAIVYNTDSVHQQGEFLDTVCQLDIANYFDCDTSSLESLLNFLKTISKAKTIIKVSKFFDSETGVVAYQECVDDLVENCLFEDALEVARSGDINPDLILIRKWDKCIYSNQYPNLSLINVCDHDFMIKKVAPKCVVKFYTQRIYLFPPQEKYVLLKMAYKWSKSNELNDQQDLEKQLILAFISTDSIKQMSLSELIELAGDHNCITFKEMTQKLENISISSENLSESIIEGVRLLLERSLDINNFFFALKLEKGFGCKSFDLTVLKTCHKIAEESVTPYNLDKDQQNLLFEVKYFGKLSVDQYDTGITESPKQLLVLIHNLVEKLEHGLELGQRILGTYRMSLNMEIPYYVILSETDHLKMLKLALDEDCSNKLEIINDFLVIFKPSAEQVADLFCGEIVTATIKYVKSKTEKFVMWELDMNHQFHLVLQTLKDGCSTLGYKLYNYASVLHKAQLPNEFDFRISELALVVELLVMAHNCFTADCNMDGISMVLRKNRSLICHLLTLRSWKLIVRLFIGTGRFSEMNYVFNILKEHEHFEYLLRKGSRKDDRLKESLLEYIRRFCPDDTEHYKMVALHFTLYSEVAELWERESEHLTKDLIAIAKLEMENEGLVLENERFVLLSDTPGTEKYLDKILQNYTHATEFHIQGGKLTRAMQSIKKCELVALQKSLFRCLDDSVGSSAKVNSLLNISLGQITDLISTVLSFPQSYILVQAYNYVPDWASVIHEQCVLRNNFKYLYDYMCLLPFNESLVQDISRKFINANLNKPEEIQNMKRVVSMLVSVHAKYRIASELGFIDLVEELLSNGQLSYLKDTVWKKGYKGEN